MIEFKNLSKTFPGTAHPVLEDITLRVPQGSFFVLLGSSGSGKTTLLKTVNRLVGDFTGQVLVGGRDNREIPDRELRLRCGFVFQNHALLPHMTVAQNVSLPLQVAGGKEGLEKRVQSVLNQVGLDSREYADRYPDELSGGQAQRVGVARALVGDPPVVLMDEPLGALDGVTRGQLQQELKSLKARTHTTFLFVTHDLFEAIELADHVAVLHQGKLLQVGTPVELLNHPSTAYVEELFRKPRQLLEKGRQ